ncbi:type II toxin-antitoxin system RelE family toxin [Elizabethkingia anophelis]|uniref:type II toxin-antitoxin system RelE family toxin n=1 Tax=Elizabethkingia anophelis TaxID=1117645 RepID=UPI0002ACB070|nr:plasmid stabilization system [Elizabethkingia anophelis]ELR81086.1 plasmid stabilization system [Elizabethkingia anophelis R26]MCS7369682.1 plasmid stabilization protein [Elizabethkingia anophelis]MCS7374999.1 plasmid stabilization protein [Elizabethkingia anophelis]MCS7387344.1 plasmid stabilization protein [Elizabethkingia anophelis]MDV4026026.1 plasmid stabilization protein [Elizabethkingia anophelis]
MEVIFLRSFLTDIKKLNDEKLKTKIKEFIIELENAETIDEIHNVKKLKGYSTAFRWRTGDYRLGFYKDENIIELARFVKRNDIYKVFP